MNANSPLPAILHAHAAFHLPDPWCASKLPGISVHSRSLAVSIPENSAAPKRLAPADIRQPRRSAFAEQVVRKLPKNRENASSHPDSPEIHPSGPVYKIYKKQN